MRRRLLLENNGNTIDGHEYVDLGLPSGTLWATMNVGATSESEYGNYYMYGKGSRTYVSWDYIYYGIEDPLALSADTATVEWGGSWHTPTSAQYQELIDECTWTWGTSGGTNGYTASKNGKSIFLPAAGSWYDGSWQNGGYGGVYWSSTPYYDSYNDYYMAYYLNFEKNWSQFVTYGYSGDVRKLGFSVRPVVG